MEFKEVSPQQKNQYDQFVAAQESGSFLQSWEWGEWQESLGRQVFRFLIIDDNNPVGSIQFIKTPISFGKYYLYSPYGPVISGQWSAQNTQKFIAELKLKFPQAVFFRIEPQIVSFIPDKVSLIIKSANIQPGITMVVDLQKTDEELLTSMHHKTRYNIKVAEKHGVVVQSDLVAIPQHGLYVKEALDLIVATQVRQKYRGHTVEYYKNLVDFFAPKNHKSNLKVIIYKALYNRQLLATGIMIDFGRVRVYLYGGSSEENRNVMAPYLLHWQAMKEARDLGIGIYDLGGSEVASGGERGFTRFKQGFGGRVVAYAGAYDIVKNNLNYKIYSALRKFNKLTKKLRG